MLSVHRETLAKVPNAKVGRDSLDISIYGMEGVPAQIIQEKMISKIKKKTKVLQEDIQNKVNLNQKLNPQHIQELKDSNEFFKIFKEYTNRMELAAGVRYMTDQPMGYSQNFLPPPPPAEEAKNKLEQKRESKFQSKLEEEKSALPSIMKDEMKERHLQEQYPSAPVDLPIDKPSKFSSVNIADSLNISHKHKKSKGKDRQDIMIFVSKQWAEEKRAKLEKYRYDEKKITSKLKNLHMSIEERLNAFKNK